MQSRRKIFSDRIRRKILKRAQLPTDTAIYLQVSENLDSQLPAKMSKMSSPEKTEGKRTNENRILTFRVRPKSSQGCGKI